MPSDKHENITPAIDPITTAKDAETTASPIPDADSTANADAAVTEAPTSAPAADAEDEADEDSPDALRKYGAGRFFELLGRDLWSFYKASILCCVGFLPAFALVVLGIMGNWPLLCVAGGLAGGAVAAPFLCGLLDTILRALRDEPGYWWHNYRTAWLQNWRDSLIPGAMLGGFGGLWCYLLSALPGMENVPVTVWICMLVGLLMALGFFSYLFAQIPLVSLPLKKLIKNSGMFFFGYLPRTLIAAVVQGAYWAVVLMYMPISIPALLVTGFWFPCVIALMIIYPGLNKAFSLEKTITERRDAELADFHSEHFPTEGGSAPGNDKD